MKTIWLIERIRIGESSYLCGSDWVSTPQEACWFRNQRDAQGEIDRLPSQPGQIVRAIEMSGLI